MRKFIIASAAFGLLALPAQAGGFSKFKEDMSLPQGASVSLDIQFSEDMQQRAVGLPEKLSDRSSSRGLRDGFGGNGYYGERELDKLSEDLAEELTSDLTRAGYQIADAGSYTLRVTVVDAKPNRPTMKQLSVQPSLSYNSFGIGGARLEAELLDAAGNVIGTSSYGWYETSIRDVFPAGTWQDAKRTFSRFASNTAKTIGN